MLQLPLFPLAVKSPLSPVNCPPFKHLPCASRTVDTLPPAISQDSVKGKIRWICLWVWTITLCLHKQGRENISRVLEHTKTLNHKSLCCSITFWTWKDNGWTISMTSVTIPCLYLHFISSLLAIHFQFSSNPLLAFLLLSFLLLSFSLFSLSIIQPSITQPFHYSALLLSDISTSINTLDFHL